MMHTIAYGWRLRVWTMLQTGAKLYVGLAPTYPLHLQVGETAALA
jgi:hypothetical protein